MEKIDQTYLKNKVLFKTDEQKYSMLVVREGVVEDISPSKKYVKIIDENNISNWYEVRDIEVLERFVTRDITKDTMYLITENNLSSTSSNNCD